MAKLCAKAAPPVVEIDAPDGTKGLRWWGLESVDEVLKHAMTAAGRGLTEEEVLARRARYGPNKMTEVAKKTFLERLWDQVNNALIWVLIGAAAVEAGFQAWADVILIVAVVVINVAIGMAQEGKAEKAADAIKAMMSPTATVIRDGKKRTVDADELVPGDLVFVQSGDRIPADLRLIVSTNLQVMEAVLTGESVAVEKVTSVMAADAQLGDRKNCAFGGTMVVYGQGTGVVIATGDAAELGKINTLVSSVEAQTTPLMDSLETFGQWIAGITIFLALATFLISYLVRGNTPAKAFSECVGVAVAIIPEGLPSVTTITLALGVQAMARQKAIIRQLPAVETLGSVGVICTDKTGTLTKNEMTVVAVRTSSGVFPVTGSGYVPVGDVCAPADPKGGEKTPLAGEAKAAMSALLRTGLLANDASLLQRKEASTGASPGTAVPATPSEIAVVVNSVSAAQWQMSGDPTEGALLTLAMKAGVLNIEAEVAKYPRIATIPFECELARASHCAALAALFRSRTAQHPLRNQLNSSRSGLQVHGRRRRPARPRRPQHEAAHRARQGRVRRPHCALRHRGAQQRRGADGSDRPRALACRRKRLCARGPARARLRAVHHRGQPDRDLRQRRAHRAAAPAA